MKIAKILTALGLMMAVVMVAPSDVSAARTRNSNTGYRSRNRTVVRDDKSFVHGEFKLGGVSNNDVVVENTGGNNTDYNTGGSNGADSGNATGDVMTSDSVNYSNVNVAQSDSEEDDSAVNDTTGAFSTNVARVNKTRRVLVLGASIGGVSNDSVVVMNTGGNSASGNTGGSNTTDSGDADVLVDHYSDVNSTEVIVTQ